MREQFWDLIAASRPGVFRRMRQRLRRKHKKRYFRCPACRAVQSVPAGSGQTKVVCRRCGEIYLRRT